MFPPVEPKTQAWAGKSKRVPAEAVPREERRMWRAEGGGMEAAARRSPERAEEEQMETRAQTHHPLPKEFHPRGVWVVR